MFAKYKIKKIIQTYSKTLEKILGLEDFDVEYHIVNSKSKNQLTKDMEGTVAYCIAVRKTADIVLFYDQINSEKNCISTLVHELLHARMSYLFSEMKKDVEESKHVELEEELVQQIERLFIYSPKILRNKYKVRKVLDPIRLGRLSKSTINRMIVSTAKNRRGG